MAVAVVDSIGAEVYGADHDAVADFVPDVVGLDVAFGACVKTGVVTSTATSKFLIDVGFFWL